MIENNDDQIIIRDLIDNYLIDIREYCTRNNIEYVFAFRKNKVIKIGIDSNDKILKKAYNILYKLIPQHN